MEGKWGEGAGGREGQLVVHSAPLNQEAGAHCACRKDPHASPNPNPTVLVAQLALSGPCGAWCSRRCKCCPPP